MKVLHLNNQLRYEGGSEQYIFSICRELKKIGIKNIVIHGSNEVVNKENFIDQIYYISFLNIFERRFKEQLRDRIQSVVKKENPDLIYLHNIHNPYIVVNLLGHQPVVKYVHDHELYCSKASRMIDDKICFNNSGYVCFYNALRGDGYRCMGKRRLANIAKTTARMIMNKKVHKSLDKFFVASHYMKQNLIRQGYLEHKIEVIPHFTDIQNHTPRESGGKNILFIGRICHEKGIEILIDSLELLDEDFQFIVVGNGSSDYIIRLNKKLKQKGLNKKTKLIGWINNNQLSHYYNMASLVVIPSIWPEPFGIVGIEAMAHGKPTVAFDVGGIPEWLENEKSGFLVNRGDVNALARKISILLNDASLRKQFGQYAQTRALALYAKENHIRKLVTIFEQLVNSNK
jgi:glycosyltransferase involved in cell wall biosynthesis